MSATAFIASLSAAGACATGFVLRHVFAYSALKKVTQNAEATLQRFIRDNTFVAPLQNEPRASIENLDDIVSSSTAIRDALLEEMRHLPVPKPELPFSPEEIKLDLTKRSNAVLRSLQSFSAHKTEKLAKEQIKYRYKKAKAQKAHAGKDHHTAGNTVGVTTATTTGSESHAAEGDPEQAQSASISDTPADTEAADHTADADLNADSLEPPDLNEFEQMIVDTLDNLGLIDIGVNIIDTVEDIWNNTIGEMVPDSFESVFMDTLEKSDEVVHGLGIASLIRGAVNEYTLMQEGLSTPEESAAFTLMSQTAKVAAMSLGGTVDTALGGTGLVIFSALVGARATINAFLKSDNESLASTFNRLAREIREERQRVEAKINSAHKEFVEEFNRHLETCPDINDDPSLKEYVDDLRVAYTQSLARSENTLSDNTHAAVSSIPKRNWLDYVLFIDRHKAVSDLFLKAQRQSTSTMLGVLNAFCLAADRRPQDAVRSVRDNPVFTDPATEEVIKRTSDVTAECSDRFSIALTAWEKQTRDSWSVGIDALCTLAEAEAKGFQAFVQEREGEMNTLRRKIRANNRRMGINPATA